MQIDMEQVRENRLALQKKLYSYFFEQYADRGKDSEVVKRETAQIVVDHFKETGESRLWEQYEKKPLGQSIQIPDNEIKDAIKVSGGRVGHEKSGSELPYELWLQTFTSTYKEHFGDQPPKVQYHGTRQEFNNFNDDTISKEDNIIAGTLNFGVGHYFSDNKDYARYYGDTKTFLVKEKNLFNASPIEGMYNDWNNWRTEEEQHKDQAYLLVGMKAHAGLSDERYSKNELLGFQWIANNMARNSRPITDIAIFGETAPETIKKAGFEGVTLQRQDGRNEIVIYNSHNIIHTLDSEQVARLENELKQELNHTKQHTSTMKMGM